VYPEALPHRCEITAFTEARKLSWERISNGALLKLAEDAGFDLLLTTDKNIRYQQNLSARTISIVTWFVCAIYLCRMHCRPDVGRAFLPADRLSSRSCRLERRLRP
jgi:hypothetical protein